ncbi:hypothetical protein DFH27DRAFT_619190 [Peziza echinospora]|nr:hypothetical protein DFH27DRAFT_619190 [Peziza echinospora]
MRLPTLSAANYRSLGHSIFALLTLIPDLVHGRGDDLQQYLSKYDQKDNLWYPTGFTRDIIPKALHSHNDYWPIAVGAISVEADVWKFTDMEEIYVGHDTSSLTKNRTFSRMYIDPILTMLKNQNPDTEFVNNTRNGVFDTSPGQTLYLYVDLKTAAEPTYHAVRAALAPLLSPKNYLTHYDSVGEKMVRGPVTVILTGNAPFDLISATPTSEEIEKGWGRYVFYDCPLTYLTDPVNHFTDPAPGGASWEKYNTTNVIMGTAEFGRAVGQVRSVEGMSERQKARTRELIKSAHDRGVGVRFWDTPVWSVRLRNVVWRQLVEEGVDLLNVDDLKAAAFGDW